MTAALHSTMHAANGVTAAGATSAVLFWGLHASDIFVALASVATVLGVLLQFYLAFKTLHQTDQKGGDHD